MYKHYWYSVDSGLAIRCDKCDVYYHMSETNNFFEIEKTESCPVSEEEFERDLEKLLLSIEEKQKTTKVI